MQSNDIPSDDSVNATGRLSAADRETQRAELVQEIRGMGGIVPESKGETSDEELAFFRNVIAWEKGPFITQRAWFERRGFKFASHGELSGDRWEKELWRLIAALAEARIFISFTDHLSDEELYKKLSDEVLADEVPDIECSPADGTHWDFSDASSGDPVAWLTYYASEDERADWLAEFPDTVMPPHRPPPFARDHRLPVRD